MFVSQMTSRLTNTAEFNRRLVFAYFFVFSCFFLLFFRLWYLQVNRSSYFVDLSKNNRTRKLIVEAPRGEIFDREYRLLVGNRPSFNIGLILEDVKDLDKLLLELSEVIDIPVFPS